MARSEARLSVDLWDPESDFNDLTPMAQRLFVFLLSQPDLAHSGVLALRERRWTGNAKGLTVEQIALDLKELEHARYIVVDYDREELLIRSFIRRDKVYRQPNVLRAALDHIPLITSKPIRRALAQEVRRVLTLEVVEGSQSILMDILKALGEPLDMGPDMPTANPSGDPSQDSCDMPTPGTPGERGVVTTVSKDSPYPVPRSENTSASDEPMLDGDDLFAGTVATVDVIVPRPIVPHTHPKQSWTAKDIDNDPKWIEFWAAYPSIKDKGHARTTWLKWLRNGIDPDVLTAGALAYRNDPKRDREYTKHAGTWLNGECWHDYDTETAAPGPIGPRPFWEN
jgi:hypothetical protein